MKTHQFKNMQLPAVEMCGTNVLVSSSKSNAVIIYPAFQWLRINLTSSRTYSLTSSVPT